MTATRLVPLTPIAARMRRGFHGENNVALQRQPDPQRVRGLVARAVPVISSKMELDLLPVGFVSRNEFSRGRADQFPDIISAEAAVRNYDPACDPFCHVVFGTLTVFDYTETVHVFGEIVDSSGFFLEREGELHLKPGSPFRANDIQGCKVFEATLSLTLEMFLRSLPAEERFVGRDGGYNSVLIWGRPSAFAQNHLDIDLGVKLWRLEELE